jgi:predicted Zn-dependent protease
MKKPAVVADRLPRRVAQPRYPHGFKFFLVHESQPNAFATPGGNVYVVDSLLYFVKNTEQLAGTLCHEVSHTIHRDGVTLMEKEHKIEEREVAGSTLARADACTSDRDRTDWQAALARLFSRCRVECRCDRLRYLCRGWVQPVGTRLAVSRFPERQC